MLHSTKTYIDKHRSALVKFNIQCYKERCVRRSPTLTYSNLDECYMQYHTSLLSGEGVKKLLQSDFMI